MTRDEALNHPYVIALILARAKSPCVDCGNWAHPFMLRPALWVKAAGDINVVRFLCIPCVEQRLKRPLKPRDFDADELQPCNAWVRFKHKKLVLLAPGDAWEICLQWNADHFGEIDVTFTDEATP